MKFAKLIELPGDVQVLVTVENTDEDGIFDLKIRSEFDGFHATVSLEGIEGEENAIKSLNDFTEVEAMGFIKETIQLLQDEAQKN